MRTNGDPERAPLLLAIKYEYNLTYEYNMSTSRSNRSDEHEAKDTRPQDHMELTPSGKNEIIELIMQMIDRYLTYI